LKLPLFRMSAAVLLVAGLSGCVVVPSHRGHHHRGVDVRVALPLPHVVIRPGRHHHRDDRRDDRYERGDERGWGRGPY